MKKYNIYKCGEDFSILKYSPNMKGSRKKRLAFTNNLESVIFKYEHPNYNVTESCSEKLSYELANFLEYNVAKIEFARDENGNLGILNYLFINSIKKELFEAVYFLNRVSDDRKEYYTIANIKKVIDSINPKMFKDFVGLMVFDALIRETDRHEENWGFVKDNNNYSFAPFYDNGCNLLRDVVDEQKQIALKNNSRMDSFIKKSKTYIYNDITKKRYKHFELIEYLHSLYPKIVKKEIRKLNKLSDDIIEEIVKKVPDELLTLMHKELIIVYLKKRRDLLLNIISK